MANEPIQLDYSSPTSVGDNVSSKPPVSRLARAASVCAAVWFIGAVLFWITATGNGEGIATAIAAVFMYLPAIGLILALAALIQIASSSGRVRGSSQAVIALIVNLLWLGIVLLVGAFIRDWNRAWQ